MAGPVVANGSGKSTIAKLLRLYLPESGKILITVWIFAEYKLKDLRTQKSEI